MDGTLTGSLHCALGDVLSHHLQQRLTLTVFDPQSLHLNVAAIAFLSFLVCLVVHKLMSQEIVAAGA